MKKQLFMLLIILLKGFSSTAQIGINATNTPPNPSAMLDVSSTNKGFLPPRMTTAQRSAIASPANGLLVFDTDTQSYWFRQGGVWVNLLANASGYWLPSGVAGNEIKNTNSGGFWSANFTGLTYDSDNTSNPPTAPVSGGGTRMMWIPSRSAFRVGTVLGADWDANNIGLFSFASGFNAKAMGIYTIAMGLLSSANGSSAVAIGDNSTADGVGCIAIGNGSNTAQGIGNTAIGTGNTALGQGSVAIGGQAIANGLGSISIGHYSNSTGQISLATGEGTTASGNYATAMGLSTNATGYSSTAMGESTLASGKASTAMGYGTTASGVYSISSGSSAVASGAFATSMGTGTDASGFASVAMGNHATASGENSVAMGNSTASGDGSTAMGSSTTASGTYSTAMGRSTIASGDASTVIGKYNVDISNSIFLVGNGSDANHRFNALTIKAGNNFVGIGTDYPIAPLHVVGTGYVNCSVGRVFNYNSNSLASINFATETPSIVAENAIITKTTIGAYQYMTNSDYRIKKIIGLSDNGQDLARLRQINITNYHMKDRAMWGDKIFKKVIAQDVEKIYPEAVSKQNSIIPDIYMLAQSVVYNPLKKELTIVMEKNYDLKINDNVELVHPQQGKKRCKVVAVAGSSFTVNEWTDATDKVFVFGREVNDFRVVDYEALSMLSISAIQELAKQNEELKLKIKAFEGRFEKIEALLSSSATGK